MSTMAGHRPFSELRAGLAARVGERRVAAAEQAERDAYDPGRPMPLSDVRKACDVSQTELADRLGVAQAQVSRTESQVDPKLSSLARYVGALGGRLELVAVIDDERFVFELPADDQPN